MGRTDRAECEWGEFLMANYIATDTDLGAVADAIRTKGGTSAQLEFPQGFVDAIDAIETGGGTQPVKVKDVTFYDYDGTPVASYTENEAYALTALPPNPTHSGLTAQGWNWTLSEIKAQIDDCPGGTIDVGQLYITDDGKTRLYIKIPDNTPASRMTFYVGFSATVVGGVTIDWGDGSTETNTAKAATAYPHTYATPGQYLITLTVTSGTATLGGSQSVTAYGSNANTWNRARIQRVELGANMALGKYAFDWAISLDTITIPTSVTNLGERCFQNQKKLNALVLPKCTFGNLALNGGYVTVFCNAGGNGTPRVFDSPRNSRATIQSGVYPSALFGHIALERAVIPNSMQGISSQVFYNCTALTEMTIPENITSIGTEAFRGCTGMGAYHLKPTTPPALGGTNAFTSIPADCVIYVPFSSDHSILDAYQNATNWSTYASYMQEEPE